MACHAKSKRQKTHIEHKEHLKKRAAAVEAYRQRQAVTSAVVSMRAIAHEFEVSDRTLSRDLNPKCTSIYEFNANKRKLTAEQEAEVVRWAISLADRNLSLTPSLIHEHALLVYQATHPNGTLGHSWTNRFLDRHGDELQRHWSRPLDKIRAMSATPAIIAKYFANYKAVVGENGEKIPPHRQFAYDESGVLRGHSQPTRVISSHANKVAKVNKGGSRELTTFLPIISGDGKLVNSLVVFQGKLLRREWIEDNPGNFA
jgi:Tc5 transposase DNA-binding domain